MKKTIVVLTAVLVGMVNEIVAQQEIPVDLYTGTPNIQVPLWVLADHDISIPVALSYNANGIQYGQSKGNFGLGWNLTGMGAVRRNLRGLPDDFAGTGSDLRRGWLYPRTGSTSVASEVGALANSSDASTGTCSDETADNATLGSWNYLVDTEPDIFSFSFPGYSGSFVFDNNAGTPAIRLIPYQDVDIRYTTVSATDKRITSFVIKTNEGYAYTFSRTVKATKQATSGLSNVGDMTFLLRDYMHYSPLVEYNQEWKISRIDSPTGAFVIFSYSSLNENDVVQSPVRLAVWRNATPPYETPYTTVNPYTINESTEQYWLNEISGSAGNKIEFKIDGQLLSKVIVKDFRRAVGDEVVKEYWFSYDRVFLSMISEYAGCDKKPPYTFKYLINPDNDVVDYGVVKDFWNFPNGASSINTFSSTNPYHLMAEDAAPQLYIYPGATDGERFRLYPIPSYAGTSVTLNGVERAPDEGKMKYYVLNQINYPSGGGLVLQYEAHRFHDDAAGQDQLAGGLRIKSITQYDGMQNVGRLTKEFDYKDPSTGKSSGKLIYRPQFTMPAWRYRNPEAINDATKDQYYSTLQSKPADELWKFLTIRSETDLSDNALTHGAAVGYQYVTVKRSGAGKAVFEFTVPGTYGQSSQDQWTATINKMARPSNCPSASIASGGAAWSFPYADNPDIDQERGLVSKKWEYAESGALVQLTENTYQNLYRTGQQAIPVWCVKYDRYPNSIDNIFLFGKYALLTDYSKVMKRETITTFDSENASKKMQQWKEYTYGSANHKLITKITTSTGNGDLYASNFKYPLDFGTIAANSEPALLRIKDLQNAENFRHGMPLEQWTTFKPAGGIERTTGASRMLLSDFGTAGKILTQYSQVLRLATPVTDFAESHVELVAGTYKLIGDARYETTNTINKYEAFDSPVEQTGTDRVNTATVLGYGLTAPVAVVANAKKDQFAFSDFETTTSNSFQVTNAFFAAPRTGANGLHPYATLAALINKSDATSYVLSFWCKSNAPVDFQVLIKSTDLATTYQDITFTYSPTAADFQLIRKAISVSAAPASFMIQLKGQSLSPPGGSSSTLTPSIDDVRFVPDAADLTSYTYNFPYGVASATNARDLSTFTEYDKLGRQTLVRDQNKNIRARNTYSYPMPVPRLSALYSTTLHRVKNEITNYYNFVAYPNEVVTFTAQGNPCFQNVTYEWDFGTGTFVSGGAVATHAFTTSGEVEVKLRVSAPGENTVQWSQSFTVLPKPIEIVVCANGATTYQCGDETYVASLCPSRPSPGTGTIFYADLSEAVTGATYTWKKRYLDDETWVNVSNSIGQFSIPHISGSGQAQRSFAIKCVVTTPDGRIGESNSFVITVSCP